MYSSFGPSQEDEDRDHARVDSLELAVNKASFDEALMKSREFQEERPHSTYLQAARYWEARALEGHEKWSEADALYRDISEKTLQVEPKWTAASQYRLAFVAEAEGDDLKALSRLLSAQKMAADLPVATAAVELPARLGLAYARLGRDKEATKWLGEADAGLRRFLSSPDAKADKSWLAQLYFQMGMAYPGAALEDDVGSFVKSRLTSQNYLMKSMDLADPTWSPQAQKTLMLVYRDTWNTIMHDAPVEGADPVVANRLKRERQVRLLTGLLRLIDAAKARRSLDEKNESATQKNFFGLLAEIERKANSVLYTNAEMTVLTHESVLLNSPRREGTIFSKELLPEEKASEATKTPDPNL